VIEEIAYSIPVFLGENVLIMEYVINDDLGQLQKFISFRDI